MDDIVVKDLIKVYKTGKSEVIALRGLDCTIKGHEILAIMGPSGCGKTTLLNIIGGLDRPTAGSVTIDGVNLVDSSDAELVNHRREKVGIVFQFFNLVPTLTAKENIELPMRLAAKDSAHMRKRTSELLKLVDMEQRAGHKPDELSGGEQQRVGLAVALANDPPVLLADEPTGELDTATGQQILHLFKRLRDEQKKTIVIVTHDLRIGQIADTVMNIVDGRITGTVAGRSLSVGPATASNPLDKK
ncbi:MAG: ABC transporter ATP-binding protein [Euryarchaeota archaeon RBG_16_62_10]|nr:MAG: ABC transporter ATP-binding protein [Euryarchaeota archaeon RBG_16_62_10]